MNEDRLWLPTSHEKLYLKLKSSADTVAELERCKVILRGTLDFEQSTAEIPIFRFLCRQENGRTYNELVDGNTGRALTTVAEQETEEDNLSEAERQKMREQMEAKAINDRKIAFQTRCYKKTQRKISMFQSAQIYRDDEPLKQFEFDDVDENFVLRGLKAIYQKDFDAKDIEGAGLEYRVVCELDNNGEERVRIEKRTDSDENDQVLP